MARSRCCNGAAMTQDAPRVAVVGGGIAGLTAAYGLAKRGIAVEVLEREATPGGRMRSERHGAFVVERGAQFIASSYRNMHALASELGVGSLIHPLRNTRNAVLKRGRFVASEYEGLNAIRRSRDLTWQSKLRLLRILFPLWRYRKLLDFYRPEKAAPLDDESAAEYVRRQFGREVLDYLVEPAFASTFTVLPENLSKAFLLSTVAAMFGGFRLQAFNGGNGALTQALASRLPVRLNADAGRVEATAEGGTVRWGCERPRRWRPTPPSSPCRETAWRRSAPSSPTASSGSSIPCATPPASSSSLFLERRP